MSGAESLGRALDQFILQRGRVLVFPFLDQQLLKSGHSFHARFVTPSQTPAQIANPGQFIGVLFDQIGETVQQPSAFRRESLAPWSALECLPRGFDGFLHVGGVGFGNLADFFSGCRIECPESLAGFAPDRAVIDEELRRRNSSAAIVERSYYRGHIFYSFSVSFLQYDVSYTRR